MVFFNRLYIWCWDPGDFLWAGLDISSIFLGAKWFKCLQSNAKKCEKFVKRNVHAVLKLWRVWDWISVLVSRLSNRPRPKQQTRCSVIGTLEMLSYNCIKNLECICSVRLNKQANKSKSSFRFSCRSENAIQLKSAVSLNQINEITIIFVNIVTCRVKCYLSA